jgi:Leucine-rich repeat (LRR) protein
LRRLSASDNYITDVSPLAELASLEYADLSKNAVADWRVLDGLIDTRIIR